MKTWTGEEDHYRQDNTTIVEGAATRGIGARAATPQIEDTTSDYDRETPSHRTGRGGIIKAAATETEMKEKKARVDAMHATKAAVEEALPRGGVALLRAARSSNCPSSRRAHRREDHHAGHQQPMRWIAANAGHEPGCRPASRPCVARRASVPRPSRETSSKQA
jgi:chaperonin GroEL (HSP60 family)